MLFDTVFPPDTIPIQYSYHVHSVFSYDTCSMMICLFWYSPILFVRYYIHSMIRGRYDTIFDRCSLTFTVLPTDSIYNSIPFYIWSDLLILRSRCGIIPHSMPIPFHSLPLHYLFHYHSGVTLSFHIPLHRYVLFYTVPVRYRFLLMFYHIILFVVPTGILPVLFRFVYHSLFVTTTCVTTIPPGHLHFRTYRYRCSVHSPPDRPFTLLMEPRSEFSLFHSGCSLSTTVAMHFYAIPYRVHSRWWTLRFVPAIPHCLHSGYGAILFCCSPVMFDAFSYTITPANFSFDPIPTPFNFVHTIVVIRFLPTPILFYDSTFPTTFTLPFRWSTTHSLFWWSWSRFRFLHSHTTTTFWWLHCFDAFVVLLFFSGVRYHSILFLPIRYDTFVVPHSFPTRLLHSMHSLFILPISWWSTHSRLHSRPITSHWYISLLLRYSFDAVLLHSLLLFILVIYVVLSILHSDVVHFPTVTFITDDHSVLHLFDLRSPVHLPIADHSFTHWWCVCSTTLFGVVTTTFYHSIRCSTIPSLFLTFGVPILRLPVFVDTMFCVISFGDAIYRFADSVVLLILMLTFYSLFVVTFHSIILIHSVIHSHSLRSVPRCSTTLHSWHCSDRPVPTTIPHSIYYHSILHSTDRYIHSVHSIPVFYLLRLLPLLLLFCCSTDHDPHSVTLRCWWFSPFWFYTVILLLFILTCDLFRWFLRFVTITLLCCPVTVIWW